MMIPYDLGLWVGVALIVIARVFAARAAKLLPTEKKAALVDAFSGQNAYGLIPLLAFAGVYFLALRYTSIDSTVLLWTYTSLVAAWIVAVQIVTARKLRALELGADYARWYGISRLLSYAGAGIVIAMVLFGE